MTLVTIVADGLVEACLLLNGHHLLESYVADSRGLSLEVRCEESSEEILKFKLDQVVACHNLHKVKPYVFDRYRSILRYL
jgi:hypothetical protein